jgi:DNA-binding transcriptional regulator YhcF (GntR family)
VLNTPDLLDDEIYSPAELAKRIHVHPTTVRRLFQDEEGVIALGRRTGRGRKTQQYLTLRIPRAVAARVLARLGSRNA